MSELLMQVDQAERRGRMIEARDLLHQAMRSEVQERDRLCIQLRLARVQIHLRNLDAALELLQSLRGHARHCGVDIEAQTIHLLALIERLRQRGGAALELLSESPAANRDDLSSAEVAQWWHYQGLIAMDQGQFGFSQQALLRAHEIYGEVRHDSGRAEVCDSLANLFLKMGKVQIAIVFTEESLGLKRQVDDQLGEAISLGTLGRGRFLQARYREAIELFHSKLLLCRSMNDLQGVGFALNFLGLTHLELDRLNGTTTCGRFYERSLQLGIGSENDFHAHLGLAWAALLRQQLTDALHHCDQAESLLEGHSGKEGHAALVEGVRGAVAWRSGDWEPGKHVLTGAIRTLEERKMKLETIPLLYELRDLYLAQNEKGHAVQTISRALDLMHQCGSEQGVAELEAWLAKVDSPSLIRLALEQQLPEFVVDGILEGSLRHPPGRREYVVVLFCDIRDYTAITESLSPELVVEILNEWFTEATRVIQEHGGVVDKFIGDAVMAIFGVPERQGNPAADAVRAALALTQELAQLNQRQRALGQRELRVGVGVDAGEAVIGFIGSYRRQSFTVIGDPVNVAARLETTTKDHGCEILVSEAVQSALGDLPGVNCDSRGTITIRGRSRPVSIYAVGHDPPNRVRSAAE